MAVPGDIIQLTYFRDLQPVMEVVQSAFVKDDYEWVYLETGRYRKSKIQFLRNLTKEKLPPEVDDE